MVHPSRLAIEPHCSSDKSGSSGWLCTEQCQAGRSGGSIPATTGW